MTTSYAPAPPRQTNFTPWIILGVIGAIALFFLINFANANAFGAQMDAQLKATYGNNKQILGNYTTRVAEMAQVPAMQRDDLTKVMQGAFQGRYGDKGSQAVIQMIKENYPGQLDNKLYENIQATVESGRLDFQANQTKLLDQKRVYEQNLNYLFKGFFLRLAGYPKVPLDAYNVITSTAADRSFSTGVDDGVKLRP